MSHPQKPLQTNCIKSAFIVLVTGIHILSGRLISWRIGPMRNDTANSNPSFFEKLSHVGCNYSCPTGQTILSSFLVGMVSYQSGLSRLASMLVQTWLEVPYLAPLVRIREAFRNIDCYTNSWLNYWISWSDFLGKKKHGFSSNPTLCKCLLARGVLTHISYKHVDEGFSLRMSNFSVFRWWSS